MSSYRYALFLAAHGGAIDPNAHDGYDALLVSDGPASTSAWMNDHHLVISFQGRHVFLYQPRPKGFEVTADMLTSPQTNSGK